jgi:hypothetical protein
MPRSPKRIISIRGCATNIMEFEPQQIAAVRNELECEAAVGLNAELVEVEYSAALGLDPKDLAPRRAARA